MAAYRAQFLALLVQRDHGHGSSLTYIPLYSLEGGLAILLLAHILRPQRLPFLCSFHHLLSTLHNLA